VTAAGKAAVAQNAYKHGAYSASRGYAHRGPFREDPARTRALEDGIVQSFAPSNETLSQAAYRLARAMTTSSRFAKYELTILAQASDVDVTDAELEAGLPFARNPHHDHPWIVLERAVTGEDFVRDCQMAELAPEYPHVNWEHLAYHVIGLLEPESPLVGAEPVDPPAGTDWRGLLEQTLRAHFKTPDEAKAWVREHLRTSGIMALQRQAADVAAARALAAVDKTCSTGARVDSRVASALKDYKRLLEVFKSIQTLENT